MSRMLIAASWMLIALGLCSCAKEDASAPGAGANAQPVPKPAAKPTPQVVLGKVADFYKGVKSVEVTSNKQTEIDFNGQKNTVDGELQLSAERPNRLLMKNSSGPMVSTVVCDGTKLYCSIGALNKYSESAASGGFSELVQNRSFMMAAGPAVPLPVQLLGGDPVRGLTEGVTSSTYVGKESINGNPAHHLKFQLKSMMSRVEVEQDLWVQAEGDPLILQFRQTTASNQRFKMRNTTTETFGTWKINEPISDDLFVFTPPPGAQKVDDLFAAAMPRRNQPQPEPEPIPSSGNPVIDFFRSVDRGVKSTTPKPSNPSPAKPDDARNPFDDQ